MFLSTLFLNNLPYLENFRLYGSSYIYIENKIKRILPLLWILPHDIRRFLFRKLFPKEYWRVLGARQELEKSFTHFENKHLTYSIHGFHKNRCIYVHIPKCAGISISQSIFGHCVPHSTITDYQLMFGSKVFKNYFKFTIVRNPWDRFVSSYFFLKNGGFDKNDKYLFKPIVDKFDSFTEFVKFIYHEKQRIKILHLLPQSKWIRTPLGNCPLDYIGRLENLDECLRIISSELKLGEIAIPKKINSSPRDSDYRKYYTKETREMIAELYWEDIKLLGYRFE
jgi:hypothetical protein